MIDDHAPNSEPDTPSPITANPIKINFPVTAQLNTTPEWARRKAVGYRSSSCRIRSVNSCRGFLRRSTTMFWILSPCSAALMLPTPASVVVTGTS